VTALANPKEIRRFVGDKLEEEKRLSRIESMINRVYIKSINRLLDFKIWRANLALKGKQQGHPAVLLRQSSRYNLD
jgi:hypothetical protein